MSLNPGVGRGHNGSAAINAALEDAITLDSYAVADLPDAADYEGKMIHCSDGVDGGAACLAYSNGTSWLRVLLGAAVAGA